MKIGLPYSDGKIWGHFGKAPQFIVYEVISGEIKSSQIYDNPGQGHGFAVSTLKMAGVDTVICGGIGQGAIQGLMQAGIIMVYPGIDGDPEEAVKKLINGTLPYHPEAVHAGHHHG